MGESEKNRLKTIIGERNVWLVPGNQNMLECIVNISGYIGKYWKYIGNNCRYIGNIF